MIEIVPFKPEYAAGVVELILPIQQQEFGLAISLAAQPDLQDIAGFYMHGAGNFWIALDGPLLAALSICAATSQKQKRLALPGVF